MNLDAKVIGKSEVNPAPPKTKGLTIRSGPYPFFIPKDQSDHRIKTDDIGHAAKEAKELFAIEGQAQLEIKL